MSSLKINPGGKQGDFGKDMTPCYDYKDTRAGPKLSINDQPLTLVQKYAHNEPAQGTGAFDKLANDRSLIKSSSPEKSEGLTNLRGN